MDFQDPGEDLKGEGKNQGDSDPRRSYGYCKDQNVNGVMGAEKYNLNLFAQI